MIKKAVLLAILLVALSFGSAFALEIDSLISGNPATNNNDVNASPARVFVNPGGLGDALLYGYYNVRGGNETFFAVTNTDKTYGARVRIRFREAATLTMLDRPLDCSNGSQEILDFDICLSPGDMWSGFIATDSNGVGTLHGLDTDTYVQVANPTGSWATDNLIFPTAFPTGQEFKFGTSVEGLTAEQTREGYFEIIAENRLHSPHSANSISYEACKQNQPSGSTLPDCTCGTMVDYTVNDGVVADVDNVLMGQAYIVNPPTTQTFGYVATALADFADTSIRPSPLFTANRPNLRDYSESTTIDPVNYALTKAQIITITDLDPTINAKSGMIVTFPTKWATHHDAVVAGKCPANSDDIFDDTSVLFTEFDDKEDTPTLVCKFSPCTVPGTDIPSEVNYVDFDNSGIFTSDGLVPIAVAGNFSSFTLGWVTIDFTTNVNNNVSPTHETTCTATNCLGSGSVPRSTHGWPVIGYQVETFGGSTFSAMLPVQYTTHIVLDE